MDFHRAITIEDSADIYAPYRFRERSSWLWYFLSVFDFDFTLTKCSADGLVRRTSFIQMARSPSSSLFSATSDIPLHGSIVSLHVVKDERTKDRFIIGGSDDGCLAVWSYE